MTKRITIAILSAMLIASGAKAQAPEAKKHLNVLYLFCDDLNDIVLDANPQCKAPNIKRLMAMGMTFKNAHSNAPLCAPSRASLITGLSPQTSGYFGGNQYDFRQNPNLAHAKTFIEHFRDNGYTVMGTGKIMHHKNQDTTVWVNKDGRYLYGYPFSFGPYPWDGKGSPSRDGGWGVKHPDFPTLETDVLPTSLANVPDYKPDPAHGIPGHKGWMLYGKPFKYNSEQDRDLMPDELNAKWATEQLQKNWDNPFLICVGFTRPHAPLIAPKKYFDMFPLGDIVLAPALAGDTADCAKILVRDADYGTGAHGYDNYNSIKNLGPDGLKKWTQAYLACVAYVDDQIGKVLDALEKSKYADNTLIFFSSDHGYHMGEKNWLFKNTLWSKGTRIPFVFAAPGIKPGTISDAPVSLVDFYPTIINLCKLPSNPNESTNKLPLDGQDLSPVLFGKKSTLAKNYIISYVSSGTHKEPKGVAGDYKDHHTAIITNRYRYIHCYNGEEELYDDKTDPQELHNLIGNARYNTIKDQLRSIYENI